MPSESKIARQETFEFTNMYNENENLTLLLYTDGRMMMAFENHPTQTFAEGIGVLRDRTFCTEAQEEAIANAAKTWMNERIEAQAAMKAEAAPITSAFNRKSTLRQGMRRQKKEHSQEPKNDSTKFKNK